MNTMNKKACVLAMTVCLIFSIIGCAKNTAVTTEYDNATTSQNAEAANASTGNSADSDTLADTALSGDSYNMTLTTYYYTSSVDGVERATGKYTDITFSDEVNQTYPKLVDAVDAITADWEKTTIEGVGQFAYWFDEEYDDGMTFFNEMTVDVVRFDDRLFTIIEGASSYGGGAHPNYYAHTHNLDPVTGKSYTLKEVLTAPDQFPAAIREELDKTSPELLEEIDSFYFEDGDVFEDKLTNNTFNFTVDDTGLHIIFSPYEVASYAAGAFTVEFLYEEYPDMVLESFRTTGPSDIESRITRIDGDTSEVEPYDYNTEEFEGDSASSGAIIIENPTWDYYFNDYYKKDTTSHYLTLTQTNIEPSDWLDTNVWAANHGFEVAQLPYTDNTYRYEGYEPFIYDYMYNSIVISDKTTGTIVNDLNLAYICNGPDERINKTTEQTEYIRFAKIVDDILYVEVGHWSYTEDEPSTGYIVAINLNTNELVFRSAPQVANGYNFQIVDDTLICGYGFTSEPDYIYLLDRHNGKTIQQISVKSAPYQFEVVDDTLYVATYNTAYEFKITK